MSNEYEVRNRDNLAVRVLAEDETEALETAVTVAPELDEGSIYVATDLPVGMDGDDPEAD